MELEDTLILDIPEAMPLTVEAAAVEPLWCCLMVLWRGPLVAVLVVLAAAVAVLVGFLVGALAAVGLAALYATPAVMAPA